MKKKVQNLYHKTVSENKLFKNYAANTENHATNAN